MSLSLLCVSIGSATALLLSGLSLAFMLSCRRRVPATARHIARDMSRKEIHGYWRSLDRQMTELHGRVDGINQVRKPNISIARTAPEPQLDDAA